MLNWLFSLIAQALAFFYAVIPNYAVAIVLLTIAVMLITYPLTAKQTRNMIALNQLQPEMKRLQELHKGDKQKQSEEMMALYKKHGINPLGGCLPLLLQLPLFIVMFRVIRGLTKVVYPKGFVKGVALMGAVLSTGVAAKVGIPRPSYISHSSRLYHDLVRAHGEMKSFGFDLAKKASDYGLHSPKVIPFAILIVLSALTQYISTRQIYARNKQMGSQNAQSKQMMQMQYVFMVLFAWIGYQFQAGVLVYWVVQGALRIVQQWAMYKYDPKLVALMSEMTTEIETEIAEEKKAITKSKRGGDPSKRTNGGRDKKGKRH